MTDELVERLASALIDVDEDVDGHGALFIPECLSKKHSGDCTKDPWTCARCYADEYMRKAKTLLAAFGLPGLLAKEREAICDTLSARATELRSNRLAGNLEDAAKAQGLDEAVAMIRAREPGDG